MIPLPLDDLLCFAIYSAGHAFGRAYKPLLEKLGLTYPQYLVMLALWSKDDQTVTSLGDQLFLDSSTLTPLLKRLEQQGQITRTRDPKDERQVRIRLTAAGKSLATAASEVPDYMQRATGVSRSTVDRLRGEISAIRDNILELER